MVRFISKKDKHGNVKRIPVKERGFSNIVDSGVISPEIYVARRELLRKGELTPDTLAVLFKLDRPLEREDVQIYNEVMQGKRSIGDPEFRKRFEIISPEN